MKRKINILVALILLLLGVRINTFAQRDSVTKAVLTLEDNKLSPEERVIKAIRIIDKAITNPECINDGYSWYVRGFIYKNRYRTLESKDIQSPSRIKAVEYLTKALSLLEKDTSHTAQDYLLGTRQTLKYLSSTFYNDAGQSLDPTNFTTAIDNYNNFRNCMQIADKNYNLQIKEIEFNNALATVYERMFREDIKSNVRFMEMTQDLYKHVIALDSNNWNANYNLAMLYYNYGVDIIYKMDVTADIITIESIQEEAKSLFKKALPYALKSHSLAPTRKEPIIALQGIYFSLYEFEKSDMYKAKLDMLNKK